MEFDQIVNGVPLIFVVMGLVELAKSFGVQGKALTATSFAIGVALGVLYQISLGMPVGFAGWFGSAIFALALGLVASKVYDAIRSASKPADGEPTYSIDEVLEMVGEVASLDDDKATGYGSELVETGLVSDDNDIQAKG